MRPSSNNKSGSMLQMRDQAFRQERNRKMRLKFQKVRQQKMDELNYKDVQLENYLTMDDCVEGVVETKMLTARCALLRKCISENNIAGLVQQTTFFKNWLCHENAFESGRFEIFQQAGLIPEFVTILKHCLSFDKGALLLNFESLKTFISEKPDLYKLTLLVTKSLINVCAGSTTVVDQLIESGYLNLLLNLLQTACPDIFSNIVSALGNIMSCDYQRYHHLFNKEEFYSSLNASLASQKQLLSNNEEALCDVCWLLSGCCTIMSSLSQEVKIITPPLQKSNIVDP